jgi:hypothetical protein
MTIGLQVTAMLTTSCAALLYGMIGLLSTGHRLSPRQT